MIVILVAVVLFVFQVIKRLHDIGMSAWYSLILLFLPSPIYAEMIRISDNGIFKIAIIVLWILILSGFAFILFLMVKRGQDHPNRYGECPKMSRYTRLIRIIAIVVCVAGVYLSFKWMNNATFRYTLHTQNIPEDWSTYIEADYDSIEKIDPKDSAIEVYF